MCVAPTPLKPNVPSKKIAAADRVQVYNDLEACYSDLVEPLPTPAMSMTWCSLNVRLLFVQVQHLGLKFLLSRTSPS